MMRRRLQLKQPLRLLVWPRLSWRDLEARTRSEPEAACGELSVGESDERSADADAAMSRSRSMSTESSRRKAEKSKAPDSGGARRGSMVMVAWRSGG